MSCRRAVVILLTLAVLLLTACGDDPASEIEVPAWAKVAPEQIAEAKKHGVPVAFENDLGIRFVLIPAGTFLMGSPEDEEGRTRHETQHEVTISKPFYMSITEVTNGQYRKFRPEHVSADHDGYDLNAVNQPVVEVSWNDASAYARWAGAGLPSEREWERAARGGIRGHAYPWGSEDDVTRRNAQGSADGYEETAPVARFPPNRYGLYDMVGNVWEWCVEVWDETLSGHGDWIRIRFDDSHHTTETSGAKRVIRGGGWMFMQYPRRCAIRSWAAEAMNTGNIAVGFRLVSPLPEPGERGR